MWLEGIAEVQGQTVCRWRWGQKGSPGGGNSIRMWNETWGPFWSSEKINRAGAWERGVKKGGGGRREARQSPRATPLHACIKSLDCLEGIEDPRRSFRQESGMC